MSKEEPSLKKQKTESEKKYSQYINNFFPPPHAGQAHYDGEAALSFVTPYKMADKCTKWIMDQNDSLNRFDFKLFIDATANLGGNTISFALHRGVKNVIGVELDKNRFEYLEKNIELYQKKFYAKVELVQGNFIDWLIKESKVSSFKNACVFADPPWGGSNYQDSDIIEDLYLNDDSGKSYGMVEFTKLVLREASAIVLKLPYNYSARTLTKHFECYSYLTKKVQFIFIDRDLNRNSLKK
eukprot:gene3855-7015_t